MLALTGGGGLNEWLIQRRWQHTAPGYERVAERETRYQNLALGWRDGQFTLLSDGQVSASFPDPYTAAPLAHFWMCQHPRPARVLLIGGVAEGLLGEILLHPVERVDCVEPDPGQIELIEPHLDAAGRQALGDPRVTLHHQDTRHLVKMRQGEFDLVIARLPEPTSAMRARFYSRQFYAELRRAMAEDGVLCMMAPAAPTHLSELSCAYLASLRATLYEAFPSVLVTWGDPACILAATREGLVSADPTELAERYSQRNVRSGIFSPLWFDGAVDLLDAGKIAQRAAELDSVRQVELSTDQRPAVYLQRLELLERMTSEPAGRMAAVTWLRRVRLAEIIAAMGGMAIATLALCRLRAGKGGVWAGGALVMSVGTTGFATMALSIIWLFAFQNLYGYVYARIGWIIALFMGGLMVGSAWGGRKAVLDRHEGGAVARRRLVAVDLGQALLAAAVPGVLAALGAIPAGGSGLLLIEITLSLMVGVTGVLCGAAFALAGAVRLAGDDRVGTAAGVVVGADHAGACLGAVLTGMLLVPVFGIPTAAGLLAGMKVAAGFALIITKRSGSRRL